MGTEEPNNGNGRRWHISKAVPVATLIVLLLTAAAAVAAWTRVEAKVEIHGDILEKQEVRNQELTNWIKELAVLQARFTGASEKDREHIHKRLDELTRRLERADK